MVKTLEEYFREQDLSPGEVRENVKLSEAERVFLDKHLGLREEDILERLGMEPPAPVTTVRVREVPAQEIQARETGPQEEIEEDGRKQEEVRTPLVEIKERPARQVQEKTQAIPARPEVSMEETAERLGSTIETGAVEDSSSSTLTEVLEEDEARNEREPLENELRTQEQVQLINLFLRETEYTVPTQAVQEVIRALPVTRMPEAPAYYHGIANIRGRVTPVVSLKTLLSPTDKEEDDRAYEKKIIIVCRRHGLQLGLLVDRVATMYRVDQNDIEWNIEARMGGNVAFVSALLKNGEDLIGIISIDRIVDKMVSNNEEK